MVTRCVKIPLKNTAGHGRAAGAVNTTQRHKIPIVCEGDKGMEKKKKTRFIVGWLLITAALLAGSLLVPGHGKSESVQEAMRDAVLHGTNRISLFGLKDVNPAYISSLVVVGALLLAAVLTLALAACGTKNNDKIGDMSGNGSAITGEPKTAEEALALHKELLERENALLSENAELWEKVFMAADKGMSMQEDGKNYGDFLLKTIEDAKEEFSDEEYEWLKESATEISNIENKLTELEEKYPEIMQKSMDGDMSMPAGSDTSNPPDDGSMQKFPAFEGKDLDGNTVKSDELFSANAVTVVNFWFTTCNPCVGELSELDALNKELAKKGGALIGVNTFTLDGDEAAISEAKDVLAKKGVTYQNVYFASDGEAGKFTTNIFAYPTTYVVDRNGNIVGDPIVGAITEKKQAETLQKLIDQALAADMG